MTEQHVTSEPTLGIYIHWPFCVRRCTYCAFVSCTDASLQRAYYEALVSEIKAAGSLFAGVADSIFIGGGTPSSAPFGTMAGILDTLRSAFNVSDNAEITMEANPDSTDPASVAEWIEAGVNRLSIGLQTTHAAHLFRLGRVHTLEDFRQAFANAREGGFKNINVDLMYALPLQTAGEWRQTLRFIRTLQPEHVSCYGLSLEDGTPLYERVSAGILPVPDEELEVKMYNQAAHVLEGAGYDHYEISNFARPGFQCLHNRKYWLLDNYLGLGASAHSMVGHFRFANTNSVDEYIRQRQDGDLHYAAHEFVTPAERENEFVMLRTRLAEGFSEKEYREAFGQDFRDTHAEALYECEHDGLVEVSGGCIRPTQRGFLFQNQLAMRLMTQ